MIKLSASKTLLYTTEITYFDCWEPEVFVFPKEKGPVVPLPVAALLVLDPNAVEPNVAPPNDEGWAPPEPKEKFAPAAGADGVEEGVTNGDGFVSVAGVVDDENENGDLGAPSPPLAELPLEAAGAAPNESFGGSLPAGFAPKTLFTPVDVVEPPNPLNPDGVEVDAPGVVDEVVPPPNAPPPNTGLAEESWGLEPKPNAPEDVPLAPPKIGVGCAVVDAASLDEVSVAGGLLPNTLEPDAAATPKGEAVPKPPPPNTDLGCSLEAGFAFPSLSLEALAPPNGLNVGAAPAAEVDGAPNALAPDVLPPNALLPDEFTPNGPNADLEASVPVLLVVAPGAPKLYLSGLVPVVDAAAVFSAGLNAKAP
ncbi:hypothetical protein MPER_08237 [Moniliophthora perniciosa FA553]|nr:hypothetical protein MPER_08237 [Moniliophthora perniciosa FA553]